MGFLFSACVLAGAFGGVLAYGLSRIRGAGLEGDFFISIILALVSFNTENIKIDHMIAIP